MTPVHNFIVYREDLLGASETFVVGQAESMPRFQPFYVGLRRRPGLGLPESRVHIVGGNNFYGKLQRARFKLAGPSSRLKSMLVAKHPVLMHAHFATDGCNAMGLARALNVPLVVTFHGYDVTVDDAHLPKGYVRRRDLLKARAARFICVSEFMKAQAIAKGFPSDKTVVHYTGIDLQAFSASSIVSRSPVVLFVGRLVPKKGCEYLIRAMARVQERMPEARLVVIGDGPLRQQMELQAASALKNYQFLGEQKAEVVREWMSRAMVFGAPSVTAESGDAEGFGMVFAEAQAMGLPVVSFANGGIPEAVADEQTGFLVREKDDQALAAKILLLLGNRELWMRMSQAGPVRAKRLFDIRTQATSLENLYDTVLMEWNGTSGVQRHRRPDERGDERREMAATAGRGESSGALALSRGK